MARLPKKRRVGAIDGRGRGVVIETPMPQVKRGQVLVRVRAAMISPGTELRAAKAARAEGQTDPGTPAPFGYQNAGEVIQVGTGVKQFCVGDRVACFGGGYAYIADYAVAPQNLCCLLPRGVGFPEASGTNVYLTSLQALRRVGTGFGECLLVVGLGLVGQVAAQLGRLAGMFVMGWDTLPGRLKLARRLGADAVARVGRKDLGEAATAFTRGLGFDRAILAFGGEGSEALRQVADVMKCCPDGHAIGNVAIVGGVTATTVWPVSMGNLNVMAASRTGFGYHDDAWEHGRREYHEVLLRWNTRSNMELILRLIAEKRLQVKPLMTHRLPIDRVDEAVTAHVETPDKAMGSVIVFD